MRTLRLAAFASSFIYLLQGAQIGVGAEMQSCSPGEAASKPAPPPAHHGPANAFRILWHVGTQLEDLADADKHPDTRSAIADVQSDVDGYYFLVLNWPDRPAECYRNFNALSREIEREAPDQEADDQVPGAGLEGEQKRCRLEFKDASIKHGWGKRDEVVAAAQTRAIGNLNIHEEQQQGKLIAVEMRLNNRDFAYLEQEDKLRLDRLPNGYCFLNAAGISAGNVLAYQEPKIQTPRGTLLSIPRDASHIDQARSPRLDLLPENVRIVGLLGDAFAADNVPPPQISINVRRWTKHQEKAFEQLRNSPYFGGYFFEGGAEIISTKRRPVPRIDNFADGMAWILANTDKNIFLLMPGFWEKEPQNDEEVDDLIPTLRKTLTMLNEKIGARLNLPAGEQAICSERIYLIPASYGAPVHVKTLPSERDGKLAGTVTGEIKSLAEMRRELCGAP